MIKSIHSFFSRAKLFTLAWLSVALFTACAPEEPTKKPWREELTVIVVPSENSVDSEFELQLVNLFAEQLHVKIKFMPLPLDQVMQSIVTNNAHFAASGSRSNDSESIRFGPSYQTVSEQVVCNGVPLRRMEGLLKKNIAVVAGSAQEAALHEAHKKFPALHWHIRRNQSVGQLLEEVAEGKLECTVANEEQLALARNYHPNLDSTLDIATPSKLAWAFAPDADAELLAEAQKFFTLIKQDGTLHRLLDHYYGHNKQLESDDAVAFITKARTVLPHIRSLFEEAATLTGMEWQLFAALAYQESHWDPLATSPTKVRGMMMLTEDTADRMGVTNRLDARQSIIGGAKYLLLLKEQLPLRINEPDRTWLALAAYNQGYGHLEDARVLTQQQGHDPDKWADVKKVMPLLAQPLYFEQTKYGYARGGEAVNLVEMVRMNHDLLNSLPIGSVPRLIPPTQDYKILGKSKNEAPRLSSSNAINNLSEPSQSLSIYHPARNGVQPAR
ncbi:membrane-bound lytic murein transglycosylase MltF [Candidatus Nitrotoga arctica]|uniref:Membrane-bound lytic murein transglycosylase F n=1 Tax=Candidatus Nitrotoga arctica TaxID=453162 RepID=A0ABN8AH32_9PROT|nr:membrane-bound lytic murein transglycosylase MltF [Candidatus Nitrotoga arctica]CAG9932025.1 Membrane-bound lytic murein transglycosylase F [Candidatus Nitrotoga arctica]